ncbi:MAG TPA: hypothetical protein VEZ90_15795, partial [Blastocatellia bacterium]|nr:hypothetical protein [Blastocatellia bacterium]
LNTPVPMELATIAPPTKRTLTLSSNIRDEILDGHLVGTDFATVLALEDQFSARIKCRLTRFARFPEGLFGQVFIQVDPKDRSLLSLPNKFHFLYHLIRPLRLLAKHSIRLCRAFRSPLRRLSNVPKPS